MGRYQILYNPAAGNGRGTAEAQQLKELLKGEELVFQDITAVSDYREFLAGLAPEDNLLIAGGDGTLNRFVNDTEGLEHTHPIYYYATGSGNDLWHDLGRQKGDAPCRVDELLKNLPVVTVKGESRRVINGVGYGIDGYCCEVGDQMRAASAQKINYTSIAIQGLLFHYHPTKAVVTVDGVAHTFKKAWLAPTMNGRFYGGGMMPTPEQDRRNPDGTVSVMVMHGTGKLRTLMIFPSIFSGTHVKHTKAVAVYSGHEITVQFDRPTALQIDGETILNVTEYTIKGQPRA